jgi:predicted hydrocarbon binding protein
MIPDERVVSFTPDGFKTLLEALEKTYKSAGKAMIYHMSIEYGTYLMNKVWTLTEEEYKTPVEAINKRAKLIEALGWGEYNVESMNLEEGIIKISGENTVVDSVESVIAYFLRGTLGGALGELLKRDLFVEMEYTSPGNLLFTLTVDNHITM